MNVLLGLEIISENLRAHWLSALFVFLTVLTIVVLLTVRWGLKRRWQHLFEERFEQENGLDIPPPLSDKDQEALQLIKQMRQDVWRLPEAELQLGVEVLSQRAIGIVRSIARIYHPEVEGPEYEASLIESLQLIRRVTNRLIRLARLTPFRFLGERKLSDYQRYYQVYSKINDHPILQALKRHRHIYRVARWVVNVKNLSNPLYWAGREISREAYFFMLRWFYLSFIGQVGKETMKLYSGRHFQKEEERDAALVCYRFFALMQRWGGPSPEEWAFFVDYVTGQSILEPDARLNILSKCSSGQLPKDLDEQQLQTLAGMESYRQGLENLLQIGHPSQRDKAEYIHNELITFSEAS